MEEWVFSSLPQRLGILNDIITLYCYSNFKLFATVLSSLLYPTPPCRKPTVRPPPWAFPCYFVSPSVPTAVSQAFSCNLVSPQSLHAPSHPLCVAVTALVLMLRRERIYLSLLVQLPTSRTSGWTFPGLDSGVENSPGWGSTAVGRGQGSMASRECHWFALMVLLFDGSGGSAGAVVAVASTRAQWWPLLMHKEDEQCPWQFCIFVFFQFSIKINII